MKEASLSDEGIVGSRTITPMTSRELAAILIFRSEPMAALRIILDPQSRTLFKRPREKISGQSRTMGEFRDVVCS